MNKNNDNNNKKKKWKKRRGRRMKLYNKICCKKHIFIFKIQEKRYEERERERKSESLG